MDKKFTQDVTNNHQLVYVLESNQVKEFYEQAIKSQIVSGTRTAAGLTATGNDLVTLTKLIRDLGFSGKVYEKVVNGKIYIIFKGRPGQRHIFTAARYLSTNTKVVDMAVGKAAIKSSARAGARLTFILTVPIIILEHLLKDQFLLSELVADLAVSLVKVGISAIVGAIAATAVGTVTTLAAAPLAIAIFVGLLVGWGLDKLDSKYGVTQKLAALLREIEDKTLGEVNRSMWKLEKILRWQILNNQPLGKGIFY
ncbi:hypothetical protein [Agarivorans litoreus]|uniref:hypothetical protein n=1 Tax=Agarivorans litoreus TaxID=1510455 RepID=UPI001C7DCDC9|nr:hypothetical protein [Agarivorans litoreus]